MGVDTADDDEVGRFSYIDWVIPDTAMLTGRGRAPEARVPGARRWTTSLPAAAAAPGLKRDEDVPSRLRPGPKQHVKVGRETRKGQGREDKSVRHIGSKHKIRNKNLNLLQTGLETFRMIVKISPVRKNKHIFKKDFSSRVF